MKYAKLIIKTKIRSTDNIHKEAIEQKVSIFYERKRDVALSYWKTDVALSIVKKQILF